MSLCRIFRQMLRNYSYFVKPKEECILIRLSIFARAVTKHSTQSVRCRKTWYVRASIIFFSHLIIFTINFNSIVFIIFILNNVFCFCFAATVFGRVILCGHGSTSKSYYRTLTDKDKDDRRTLFMMKFLCNDIREFANAELSSPYLSQH